MTFFYGPLHMDVQVLADQLELINISSKTQDVVWKTCKVGWRERGRGGICAGRVTWWWWFFILPKYSERELHYQIQFRVTPKILALLSPLLYWLQSAFLTPTPQHDGLLVIYWTFWNTLLTCEKCWCCCELWTFLTCRIFKDLFLLIILYR